MSKKEFSQWFTNGEKPWEPGVYRVKSRGRVLYAHWDGDVGWGAGCRTTTLAYQERNNGAIANFYHVNGRSWRGLANPPKAKP